MLKRLPEQWNTPAVADHGEGHDTEPVPEHRGVERQMQGLAWLLPLLHRLEHQWAVEDLGAIRPLLSQRRQRRCQLAARQWTIGSLAIQCSKQTVWLSSTSATLASSPAAPDGDRRRPGSVDAGRR
jgi:hypothetical protein